MPMDIELFVSNCPLCRQTQEMVQAVKGPLCTLKVYDLSQPGNLPWAQHYAIRAVPTIVANGRVMFEGVPEKEDLVKCSLEHGCRGRRLAD